MHRPGKGGACGMRVGGCSMRQLYGQLSGLQHDSVLFPSTNSAHLIAVSSTFGGENHTLENHAVRPHGRELSNLSVQGSWHTSRGHGKMAAHLIGQTEIPRPSEQEEAWRSHGRRHKPAGRGVPPTAQAAEDGRQWGCSCAPWHCACL